VLDEDVLMVIEGTSFRGLTAVRDYLAGMVRQIPGIRVELERVLADSGDTIVTLTRSVDTSPPASDYAAGGQCLCRSPPTASCAGSAAVGSLSGVSTSTPRLGTSRPGVVRLAWRGSTG